MILICVINLEKIPTWRRFSTIIWQKSKWQNISILKCGLFLTFDVKNVSVICIGQIQSKLLYGPVTRWSVSYKYVHWFWLNLHYPNSKKFSTSNVKNNSHSQMDIFYHFNFCHSRRNQSKIVKPLSETYLVRKVSQLKHSC